MRLAAASLTLRTEIRPHLARTCIHFLEYLVEQKEYKTVSINRLGQHAATKTNLKIELIFFSLLLTFD